MKITFL
jgi:hypothetical protein